MVIMLLFAIIGHEVLMVGVHAGSHVEQLPKHSVHEVHEPAGKPSKSSMHVDGHSDSGDCAPGHEFVRRWDEKIAVHELVVSVTKVAPTNDGESAPRLAANEPPGRPPGQRRALLQVFLN